MNLMAQYHMSGRVGKHSECREIARGIYAAKYAHALSLASELNVRLDARSVGEPTQLAHA